MTGTDVAVAQELWWARLEQRAAVLCKTGNMIPKQLRGNKDATMAALLVLQDYGLPANTQTLSQLHLFDGVPTPSAQLIAGLLTANGYHTRWGELSADRAEISVRPPAGDWQGPFVYDVDQARASGALDVWVEHQIADGKWPDGNVKYRTEKFVVDQPGVEVPEWAAKEITAGRTKRNENWARYRPDMLAARCMKRAVRRVASHLILGVTAGAVPPMDDDDEVLGETVPNDRQASGPAARDEDVVDAELVDEPEGDIPPKDFAADVTPEHVDADWVRRFAIAAREHTPDGIDPDAFRHAVVFTATNGRTTSARQVRHGDEAAAVAGWLGDFIHGRATCRPRPQSPDGYELVSVTADQGEGRPF